MTSNPCPASHTRFSSKVPAVGGQLTGVVPAGAAHSIIGVTTPTLRNTVEGAALNMRPTPATSPALDSLSATRCSASCAATRLDEHAVSTLIAAPRKPKVKDSRPHAAQH